MGNTTFSENALSALTHDLGNHTDPRYRGLIFRTKFYRGGIQSNWYFCLQIRGHRYHRFLGTYPGMNLEDAWSRVQLCRELLQDCFDMDNPLCQAINSSIETRTFREFWIEWITEIRKFNESLSPKYFNDILARGENHLFPYLGDLYMVDITSQDIAKALNHAYKSCSVSTVKKIRNNLSNFYQWMTALEFLDEKHQHVIAPAILNVLVMKSASCKCSEPHPAISQHDLPRFVRLLVSDEMIAVPGVLPLLFTLLTASRIGNIVGSLDQYATKPMEWVDIDSTFSTWVIPASNMKAGRTNGGHVIPLSMQAQKILRLCQKTQTRNGIKSPYVFPNDHGKRFDYRLMPILVKRICSQDKQEGNNGFIDEDSKKTFHIHGLRSTFKTWGTEHGVDWTLTELALHHQLDKLKYDRSQAIERRRQMMQEWADFCFSEVRNKWIGTKDHCTK